MKLTMVALLLWLSGGTGGLIAQDAGQHGNPNAPLISRPLLVEGFDDRRLLDRGWYDGRTFDIDDRNPRSGLGAIRYHWKAGASVPESSSGVRRLLEPSESVYLRCFLRFSPGWKWTGKPWHPHLMHFMTTENGKWHGPAASHLTIYIEPWNGHLRLAATDIQNQDAPHGLTQGPLRGGYNGTMFDSPKPVFTDDRWYLIEAFFRLNTLNGQQNKPNADGVVRSWVDGNLQFERTDVIFRTVDFPTMRFNQFLLTPYFGPGLLPQPQTLWIDDLSVATDRDSQ